MSTLLFMAGISISLSLAAADTEKGKQLFEKACTSCHGINIYKPDTKVDSVKKLRTSVTQWKKYADVKLPDSDVDDITEYLANEIYPIKP